MKGDEGKQGWMPNRHARVIEGAATLYRCASVGTAQAQATRQSARLGASPQKSLLTKWSRPEKRRCPACRPPRPRGRSPWRVGARS
eukprot:13410150-Alexandrium_andersonii.AAC.1